MPNAAYLTPMLHVADVHRSIHFYELLGLELTDYEGDSARPSWARMHSEGGDLMFLLAEAPIDASKQAFLLYIYTRTNWRRYANTCSRVTSRYRKSSDPTT